METNQIIQDFYKSNSKEDLLKINFVADDVVKKWSKAYKKADKEEALGVLKQVKRLIKLHPDSYSTNRVLTADQAINLYNKFGKIASAHEIAQKSEDVFVEATKAQFGDVTTAKKIYTNAVGVTNNVANLTATIHNLSSNKTMSMATHSVNKKTVEYFKGLPGYQDLFGNLDYCECKECRSIFGSAAYFVDLMRIIQKYVVEPNKGVAPEMTLEHRRPDIKKIELTCENTNHIIPYLTIINKRLESVLKTAWTITDVDALYKKIATTYYPFNLPFLLPQSEVRIYLERLKTSLSSIFKAFKVSGINIAMEELIMSKETWSLLSTAVTNTQTLATYYGVTDLTTLSDFNVFSTQTDLDVTQVEQLFYQNLSKDTTYNELGAGLSKQFFINKGLTKPIEVTNTRGNNTITNLTTVAEDQINRFLRLALHLGWKYADLDWTLHALNNGTPEISTTTLQEIAKFQALQKVLNADIMTVNALLFDLKTYGVGDNPPSSEAPFDIVFNNATTAVYRPKNSKIEAYPLNPLYQEIPWSWEIDSVTNDNSNYALRITSALGLSQKDLVALSTVLYGKGSTIVLNVPNISALYRHTTVAKLLNLSISQYIRLLDLSGLIKKTLTIDEWKTFYDNAEQIRTSGFTLFQVDYIVSGSNSNFVVFPTVNVSYKSSMVDSWLKTLPLLITSKAKTTSKQKEEKETKLYQQIGTFFAVQSITAKAVLQLITTDPIGVFLDKDTTQAKKDIVLISRWLVALQRLGLSTKVLESVSVNASEYEISNPESLTLKNISSLWDFQQLITQYSDVENRFVEYIDQIKANKTTDAVNTLSNATGWDVTIIASLLSEITNTNQVAKIYEIQSVIGLLNKTGLSLVALKSLVSLAGQGVNKWDTFTDASTMLLKALQARFNPGNNWGELQTQINGEIGGLKRNAIIGAVIHYLRNQPATAFVKTSRSLYEYLLIDVEMGNCSQISYIKEALNATQLYLSRCRAKLEPGIDKLPIPDVWWEWMLNYRVWEANREIFLYPENYIDPAFRKSKSTLFKQLETDLKQNDINDGNAQKAFTKYMEGFAELAKLVYVDAYYCNVSDATRNDQPTLYLFARTAIDPYTYYYIVRESEGTWSQWTKIDMTINSSHVTPIYAFNKLFLFWVEKSQSIDKDNNSSEVITKASIKYTFYNFQGDWVQPQTLVQDEIIMAQPSSYRTSAGVEKLFPEDYFNMSSLWWNKVYPMKIEKDKYWDIASGGNKFEKLAVLFGPMIDTTVDLGIITPGTIPPVSKNKNVEYFEERLYNVAKNYVYTNGLSYNGQLPIFKPLVLNDSLDISYLVNPGEILFLKEDAGTSNHLFTPQIDTTSGQLNLISTTRTIYDNYIADQIIQPEVPSETKLISNDVFISNVYGIDAAGSKAIYNQLVIYGYIETGGILSKEIDFSELEKDVESILTRNNQKADRIIFVMTVISTAYGTRCLSKDLRNKNYGLFTIKNAPSAFVFNGDKESFLMEDTTKAPVFISNNLFNGDTLFADDSFVSSGADINKAASQSIYNQLISSGFLSKEGLLLPPISIKDLKKALQNILLGQPNESEKVNAVLNVLVNTVLFYDNSFLSVKTGIDQKGSKNIFDQLGISGYLDKNGRLETGIDFNDLAKGVYQILDNQPNQLQKARFVTKVLYEGIYPSSLGYFQTKTPTNLADEYNFKATRLTTGAVHNLSASLFIGGVDHLLSLNSQLIPIEPELPFSRFGYTEPYVITPKAIDGAEVDFNGAYELYYWELFFHAPMYIAELLKINQNFQDAEKWYKYIFDPTAQAYIIKTDSFETSTLGSSKSTKIYNILVKSNIVLDNGYVSSTFSKRTNLSSLLNSLDLNNDQIQSIQNILFNHQVAKEISRVWQFRPFRNHSVESLLENITNEKQINAYNQFPFDPDAIARLRIGAYEKTVVIKYVDNLIKWGDWYFSQYSWETITTASMLYSYAYNLLGPEPENLGACDIEPPATFAEILKKYGDKIPQFKITLEDHVGLSRNALAFQPYNEIDAYFNIPENKKLNQTWDVVKDRLYKINHCLNIDGVKQPLPLFQTPIDPSLLARAAASGGNPLSILAQQGNIPYYRFSYLIEKAKNVTSSLMQLGSLLLSAIEKKDNASLTKLRATQHNTLLNLTTLVKEKQIEQIEQSLLGLQQNLQSAQNREQYYEKQYNQNLSVLEVASLLLMTESIVPQAISIGIQGISIAGYLAPNIFGFSDGGMKFGDAINAGSQIAQTTSGIISQTASILTTTAQFERRRDDWQLQQQTAAYEVTQITDQIAATTAHLASSQQDLTIHNKTIEQENDYEQFLGDKFTNEDLYVWMIGRLSTVYFQTYQLALDMALVTQSAYQNELDNTDQFIQFNNWDSLYKGLLAGEGIMLSLNQMDNAYIENNNRRFEIEKTVSLLQLNPQKFVEFKTGLNGTTKGELNFDFSEQLFDFDFPGQYCRKIKSISISIPAIVGPYQNVNAVLRQTGNIIILKPEIGAVKFAMDTSNPKPPASDYRENWIPNQKIALSNGVNDSGMFTLNFNDARYLPFEGTGAVSKWTLSLPPETNHFDFSSISDIIVKINYTAKEDGTLGIAVKKLLHAQSAPYPYKVAKQFVLQQAFGAAWNTFMRPPAGTKEQALSFQVTDSVVLPNLQNVTLESATVIIQTKDEVVVSDKNSKNFLFITTGTGTKKGVTVTNNIGKITLNGDFTEEEVTLSFDISKIPDSLLTTDKLKLDPNKLIGLVFILGYTSNVFKS